MTVLLTLCFKLIYEIIKKMCHHAYHHYGFVVTHALWHIWGAWIATKASQWQPWDHIVFMILYNITHCVKSVHIRSYFGPHFSRISRIWTDYGEIYSVQMREKYRPELLRIRTLFRQWRYIVSVRFEHYVYKFMSVHR